MQHYVKKYVTDLRHVGGFLRVLRHDITEILFNPKPSPEYIAELLDNQ
jgi:hypothetical protein